MDRVLVVGSPGAGKSTFARELSRRTGLPLVHLDVEYHLPGWVERPEDEWHLRLGELLAGDRWIIDGNYGGSMDRRLARADTAIWLDYPGWLCLWRVVKRIVTLNGKVRADAAPDCPERLDWEFLHYVAAFRRVKRPALAKRMAGFRGVVVRLRKPAEATRWLSRSGGMV